MLNLNNGFTIFGLNVKYYGIIMAVSILVAVALCYLLLPKRGLSKDLVFDLTLWAVPLGIVGARLFYVLFSGVDYSFVEAFEIWNGGLSIIGAVVFGALGVFICCKIKKVSFIKVADCIAPGLLLAQSIGRWGNFFNQEAYGPVVKTHIFPFSTYIEANNAYHASTFFYESIWNLLGFVVLMLLLKKLSEKKAGIVMSVYFMWYGFGRAIIEQFRQDPLIIFETVRFSQILSIFEFILGIVILSLILLKNKKKEIKNVSNRKKGL